METHSSILAWRFLWAEEPSRLHSPQGRKEPDMTKRLPTQYTNVTLQIPAKVCWTPVYTWRTTEENSSKLGYCRLISVFGDVIGQTFHFELNSHLQNEGAR